MHFRNIFNLPKWIVLILTNMLLISSVLPAALASFEFKIVYFFPDKTQYMTGNTPRLWVQVKNTGTVEIPGYDLDAVFSVISPSGVIIPAGYGSEGYPTKPGEISVIENKYNSWTVPEGAEAGLYDISVTVTSESTGFSLSATVENAFSVNAPPAPDYRVTATPTTQVIQQGETAVYTVFVDSLNGWTDDVSLSINFAPLNSQIEFDPPSVTPPGFSYLKITTTKDTPPKAYSFLITGISGLQYHNWAGSSLVVQAEGTLEPDYQLFIEPTSVTVLQGESTTFTVIAKAYGAYSYPVTLSTGSPTAGLKLSFSGSPTTTVTPTPEGTRVELTLNVDVATKPYKWHIHVFGEDPYGLTRLSTAIVQVNSKSYLVSVGSLSVDKPWPFGYSPTDPVTFSFDVTNNGEDCVSFRPIISIEGIGTWQSSDVSLEPGRSTSVSITVAKPEGWPGGTHYWTVILIGPPPSYHNIIYYNPEQKERFVVYTSDQVYKLKVEAYTTSGEPISGAEIYIGSRSTGYRRVITGEDSSLTFSPISNTYFAIATLYVTSKDVNPPGNYLFDHWEGTYGISIDDESKANTTITINYESTTLKAYFVRLDVSLELITPTIGNVYLNPPDEVTVRTSVKINPRDNNYLCKYSKSKTVYLRASIEGWAADGTFTDWYQPSYGLQAYVIGSGDATFTWTFSTLDPSPLPGTYSINLVIYNDNKPSLSVPQTTGMIAFKRLQWAFAFNKDHSYVEIYGSSTARIIHVHLSNKDVGDAQTIRDMLLRFEQVEFTFKVASFVADIISSGGELAKNLDGLVDILHGLLFAQKEASLQPDGYDFVIFQTRDGNYKGGAYYEVPLTQAIEEHAKDVFLSQVGAAVGLISIISLVMAVPTGGASLLLLAAVAATGITIDAIGESLPIPEALFQHPFDNLPAYGSTESVFQMKSSKLSENLHSSGLGYRLESEAVCAYLPDGSEYLGSNISFSNTEIFAKPSSNITFEVSYDYDNPYLQGLDMQLLFLYSWGGGWPPLNYIGMIGGASDLHGALNISLNLPDMEGIYYGWVVIGTGNTFTDVSQSFITNLMAVAPPHIVFVIDGTPPVVETPLYTPQENIQPYQPVKISVNVSDNLSHIKSVALYYSIDNGISWQPPVTMTYNSTSALYEAIIPGQPPDTWVTFKIVAFDYAGNNMTQNNNGYYYAYEVIPEFPTSTHLNLVILALLSLLFIATAKRKRKGKIDLAKTVNEHIVCS